MALGAPAISGRDAMGRLRNEINPEAWRILSAGRVVVTDFQQCRLAVRKIQSLHRKGKAKWPLENSYAPGAKANSTDYAYKKWGHGLPHGTCFANLQPELPG
jgi:hypothetical protein